MAALGMAPFSTLSFAAIRVQHKRQEHRTGGRECTTHFLLVPHSECHWPIKHQTHLDPFHTIQSKNKRVGLCTAHCKEECYLSLLAKRFDDFSNILGDYLKTVCHPLRVSAVCSICTHKEGQKNECDN
eukprot:TRINITY_DN10421_c0_g1_i1.p1 TRINITY_DN10421_c0_g1~~TRINITY_DN10421_c0_g1_i1.p1  ORF type:complete len:128 (-),score=6.50 TRINITY_DN10421_c0_g1_i1:49-432(-)